MGVLCSTLDGSKEDRLKSREIETQLKRDKRLFEREVKLLLLGAGESGKSTIAKQMKIIHLDGWSEEEKLAFKDTVHSNIISSMKTIVQQAEKFDYKINKKNRSKAVSFLKLDIMTELTPSIGRDIAALYDDRAIQKTIDRSNEYQLIDSAPYFFQNIDRISSPGYVPNEQDVLRTRVKTTGIAEIEFEVETTKFRMVDVGGQRSERKKWIHCFQDVTAVIFCVALSEYDLKLYEDSSVNRMHESIKLFDEICNSKWFANVSIILFLNKSDLFKEKIKKVDLSVCFPEYTGGLDFEKAAGFIQQKFCSMNKSPETKHIYPHLTCATDTQHIRFVFNAVKNIILHQALDASGF